MRRITTILTLLLLSTIVAQAQVVIGGSVYGGGNKGNVGGSTSVTVKEGDIHRVFGGARMGNVGGNAYVNIDGKNATGYTVIDYVYGGNDITGTIGTAAAVSKTTPTEVAENKDGVDNTWNTYVHISAKNTSESVYYTQVECDAYNTANGLSEGDAGYRTIKDIKEPAVVAADNEKTYVGQLFGGGNGAYKYTQEDGKYVVKDGETVLATNTTAQFSLPELDKTYVDVQGGSIVYAYGGGNNATVRKKTIIHVDNPSEVVNHIIVNETTLVEEDKSATEATEGYVDLLTDDRFLNQMGVNTTFPFPSSGEFQIGRFFGGNNMADMDIRPRWNLQNGKIRNLYSGGNKGAMTCPEGLLLNITPASNIIVDNVFGGCRMADVVPKVNGVYTPCLNLTQANYPEAELDRDYNFPPELAARVLIQGGDINNVYGGNDITGKVFGGNAIGIYTDIRGDVYGGGNGAYPYTDIDSESSTYGDLHYSTAGYTTSLEALNAFRPNAEQVSIRLAGKADNPTLIRGSVYVGGNCASLATVKNSPMVELKIGSYVVADKVFMGNNGEKMVDGTILEKYADNNFSTLTMTDKSVFEGYMEGVVMTLLPELVFDATENGDPADYVDFSSYVGSFYLGGNIGSMAIPGKNTYKVSRGLNIFDKFVGGCNNANVAAVDGRNAAYEGGVLGSVDERPYSNGSMRYVDASGNIKDRLQIDLDNLNFRPLRWNAEKTALVWNTFKWGDTGDYSAIASGNTLVKGRTYYASNTGTGGFAALGTEVSDGTNYFKKVQDFVEVGSDATGADKDIRVLGGNVYGGCYNSGHINGNVVININQDMVKKDEVFGTAAITPLADVTPSKASGVDFDSEQPDVMVSALATYGAGYGEDTEIWGSTTVNHNKGYTFLIFGGGEQGVVGKKTAVYDDNGVFTENIYEYNPAYSCTVNLNGTAAIYSDDGTDEDLAEVEYIYGGGNEGAISGNTYVNLGKGRVYDVMGGSSNADILGHTEVYIGRQPDGSGSYKEGFPWVRNWVYGGNDFGGTIHGAYETGYDFEARVKDYNATKKALMQGTPSNSTPGLLKSASYVDYLLGHVGEIYGGHVGSYDYDSEMYEDAAGNKPTLPFLENSFVNIRPNTNSYNSVGKVFGAGVGYTKNRDGDNTQNHSYVLIDMPDDIKNFEETLVFGAGSFNGVGMGVDKTKLDNGTIALDKASAVIDLLHGKIDTVFGGSYQEGVTRRTVVNVPKSSTINIKNIFGGAYGTQILPPCDVYESYVNYNNTDETARVTGAIYGGNNNERRTLFTHVNISSPVWSDKDKGYLATIYGAGNGIDTWSEHTEVNLEKGANVYEVYGGGKLGHVLNSKSIQAYMNMYKGKPSPQISKDDPKWRDASRWDGKVGTGTIKTEFAAEWAADWIDAWSLGDYYNPDGNWNRYVTNEATNLSHVDDRAELDDKTADLLDGKKYNTNVIINEGAEVVGYAYGGGLGDASEPLSGDVYGTTYIALLGGTVKKDVYAAGKAGGVDNLFDTNNFTNEEEKFTANSNAYIKGGTCRNVYGGGYLGHVGHHDGGLSGDPSDDRLAESHVVVGDLSGSTFVSGVPAILRNVYGGGEGGSVYGSSHVTMNNGYVGYRYKNTGTDDSPVYEYVEELDDQKTNDIEGAGNVFGGGYIINSYVDSTNVAMYGGTVRGSLYGGGELGPIGRGTTKNVDSYSTGIKNQDVRIFKAGKTNVALYDGWVKRNVFGGGRGVSSWGNDGTQYMDPALVATLDLKSKGYVFGQTEVSIHGGEVGTDEGVAKGYGNVLGGGDIGYVYSAYEDEDGNLAFGKKSGTRYDDGEEGYYYKYEKSGGSYAYKLTDGEKILTEDCKVLIEPWCRANAAVTINGKSFAVGEYVPTSYLNYLGNKNDSRWASLSKTDENKNGILIHNGVFTGGNTSPGSTIVYASTTTVFGNATASINDVYHRDLITIGTGHTGGLYGDGNLTLVDGYRELNVTNYGTDYYHIQSEITLENYKNLNFREAAYYEIRYKCAQACKAYNGRTYAKGSTISADELQTLFVVYNEENKKYESVKDGETEIVTWDSDKQTWVPNENYWVENGVCSRYAGRILNTIQRADFCGVWGSRMVMQGAQDRVPAVVDYTNYTINRVREVSLNKKASVRSEDSRETSHQEYWRLTKHGNYFGIYSTVNYLGALTSDFDFGDGGTSGVSGDIRTTDNDDETTYQCAANGKNYGAATFYDWKKEFHAERKRNNGNSHNKVALASGVYLELTTEKSTGDGLYEKDWGYITGVVELDLISVQPGLGGGFVYAKNVHGKRKATGLTHTTLTSLNSGAITRKKYRYDTAVGEDEWEASGNFVNSTQTIIDDCYNIGARYCGADPMPAHYWFIKGSVYIYDQYISAYTGSPNAYSETVNIPLTLTSASHGKMTLLEVQPNYYAYYSVNTGSTKTALKDGEEFVLRDVTYKLNDPITYWDYFMLSDSEKKLFVKDTYVSTKSCKIGETIHSSGEVMLPSEYTALYNSVTTTKDLTPDDGIVNPVKAVLKIVQDDEGNDVVATDDEGKEVWIAFDEVFHHSNNAGHETGYMLTYKVDNPKVWDTWYTKKDGDTMNQTGGSDYLNGPTYTPTATGLYGQQEYVVGNIISEDIYKTYTTAYGSLDATQKAALGIQATFEPAYIVTADVLNATNKKNTEQRFYKGATLGKSDYVSGTDESKWTAISGSVAPAYVVTNTIQLSETDYIYRGTYMTEAEKTAYYNRYKDGTEAERKIAAEINSLIVPAYYCDSPGNYGGNYYQTGHNYRGLEAFSSLSEEDRKHFKFNYDALDLFIDPNYSFNDHSQRVYGDGLTGLLYQYDSADGDEAGANANPPHYSLRTPVDYTATYKGTTPLSYKGEDANGDLTVSSTANTDTELTNKEYEALLNERYYYSPVTIKKTNGVYPNYYVINTSMILGDTPYAAGQVIDADTYNGLTDSEKTRVTVLDFNDGAPEGTYYYCRESYTIAKAADGGTAVTKFDISTGGTSTTTYAVEATVPQGVIINSGTFSSLTNKQANFVIHGTAPTETSTLYVPRYSDINDLSNEKIITVVYQYDYVETNKDGTSIVPVSERHVLNIHLNFKSGIPTVEDILEPDLVLPGTTVSIKEPYVTPGSYEVTGGGWELFDDENDAESHTNGIEYSPNMDPLYLYENGYLVAYYAKTYLGKTYSNAVPVHVANYHDLKKVMDAKEHHYYIDHSNIFDVLHVQPKIYINDYSGSSENGLDLFKNLYDLSVLNGSDVDEETGLYTSGTFEGHKPLNSSVAGGDNLNIILRTDIEHTASWTPIGSDAKCFEGTLHGDGHTIKGLNNSLFANICGNVYNLGVTGSFTGAGIAEKGSGYIENCWISTSSTAEKTAMPILGSSTASDNIKQMVNCYYQEDDDATNKYTNHTGNHGIPTRKEARSFYNGEVAYDLNGFYLYKRFCDPTVNSGTEAQTYKYFTVDADNTLSDAPLTEYYADKMTETLGNTNPAYSSTGYNGIKYVEDRFADGDFRYAAGEIPDAEDERYYEEKQTVNGVETVVSTGFYPIWPDDYIFFGQKLTYGYSDTQEHQEVPTAVVRDGGRLSLNADANRVYRAPAYFRSKVMGMAHFNPDVYLAQTKKGDTSVEAYPNMTAIDFAGHNNMNEVNGTYELGTNATGLFYPPLLDDDGLTGIINCDETKNLLAYAPAETSDNGYANKETHDVLAAYFTEPEYADYYDNSDNYRIVEACTEPVNGHLVPNTLTATNDHLLVDKQDFNAPIAYSFNDESRMWYQRTPASNEFVDRKKGWQGISLPFTAELVTTSDKGEITHFYSGSETSKNNTDSKVGHEYWLREFNGITEDSKTVDGSTVNFAKASFGYPTATGADKVYTNTFLWDYYYKNEAVHNQLDKNEDTYLEYRQYYKTEHTHPSYPLLTAAKPYLLGLPGETYYEFDLSGNFEAKNTANDPELAELKKQIITFASTTGAAIEVSDDQMAGVEKTLSGTGKSYTVTFKPSYLNMSLEAGTSSYTLDTAGDSYDKVPTSGAATAVSAFRPYFTASVTSSSRRTMPEYIEFSGVNDSFGEEDEQTEELGDGALIITSRLRHIIVRSTLKAPRRVSIYNAGGIRINTFVIQPGETVETRIYMPGLYIVEKKKVSVM